MLPASEVSDQGARSPQSDIVSVGIEINRKVQLRKLNQQLRLSKVIEEICKDFQLSDHEKYALQFDNHAVLQFSYITEENRQEIKDGSICKLVYSPPCLVKTILGKMVSPGVEECMWGLKKLFAFVNDGAFVEVFVESDGVTVLATLIQGNALANDFLGIALKSLAELFIQDHVPIETLKDRILDKVVSYVFSQQLGSAKINEASLSIIKTIVDKHLKHFPEIEETMTLDIVIPHLKCSNFWVQQTALGLINSIISTAHSLKRKLLMKSHSNLIRELIHKHILTAYKSIPVGEMSQQLVKFQSIFICALRNRAETIVDLSDNLVKKRVQMLEELKFEDYDIHAVRRRNTYIEQLGSLTEFVVPPSIDDFKEDPPSILVLNCMTHLTRKYHQNYTRAILEHSFKAVGSQYPFVELCTKLVTLLTDVLGITMPIDVKDYTYHRVLYSKKKAFEELFCFCIMVYNKTSKEMRATNSDLGKVLMVVKKKIQVSLGKEPLSLKSFEDFFYKLTYKDISLLWDQEQISREMLDFREKKSLGELKEEVRPELVELVKQHRMKVLTKGSFFPRYTARGTKLKNQGWTVRYIPNLQVFDFSDEEEKFSDFRLEMSNIKNIAVGQNCPHVKQRGQKYVPENAFSFMLTTSEPSCLNLVAISEKDLHHWTDGLRMLLGQTMTSPSFEEELQALMDMHLRLQLLDAYGIELPVGEAPPIPDDPPNYDFCL